MVLQMALKITLMPIKALNIVKSQELIYYRIRFFKRGLIIWYGSKVFINLHLFLPNFFYFGILLQSTKKKGKRAIYHWLIFGTFNHQHNSYTKPNKKKTKKTGPMNNII